MIVVMFLTVCVVILLFAVLWLLFKQYLLLKIIRKMKPDISDEEIRGYIHDVFTDIRIRKGLQ